jgi:hypothetical protein
LKINGLIISNRQLNFPSKSIDFLCVTLHNIILHIKMSLCL